MADEPILSRRKLLSAVGIGSVAGTVGVAYAGARGIARKGVIDGRIIVGYETDGGTIVDNTQVFAEYPESDGPPDRRFDSDYRQYLPAEPPVTVSPSVHRELQGEFDQVDYALSHSCPSADCSTPQVSRHDFNQVRVGDEVRLLYHSGDSATIVP